MITINRASTLGIGAAVLLWTASTSAPAQTIPQNVAQPLRAAANVLTGGQYGAQAYSPYGYTTASPYQYAAPAYRQAPGYGWTTSQPAYQAYVPAQPGYPTTYYNSGYRGYAQPGPARYYQQPTNPVDRAVNAARSIIQPQRYAYPTYAAPGYAPTYGYTIPR